MLKEKKKSGNLKVIFLFILFFLGIPLSILTFLYFVNEDINKAVNDYLRTAPGAVGEYFSSYPTENEIGDKEIFLARYYLSIDKESASDKLYIIKKDDEMLFNSVIKRMNSISSSKTAEIIKLVRNLELRKDLLFTIYDEIKSEQESKLTNEVKRIEQMETYIAINEINSLVNKSAKDKDTINYIFERLSEEQAVEILYFIDSDIATGILSNLSLERKRDLEMLLYQKKQSENELILLSKLYESKDSKKAFEEIGNPNNYSIDELALIYMHMDVRKASEILVNNVDDQFTSELFIEIEKQEILRKKEQSVTPSIAKTMSFINQYNDSINELVTLYEKIEVEEAANIVEKMLANKNKVSSLDIDENSLFEISDSTIIIDVLKRMKKQNVSDILSNLDSKKAAEITRILAIQ